MIDFDIVEYAPAYAAAVAEMWNKSGDSWGGYNIEFTEDSVRRQEEASQHVNLYLALVGSRVVGYCKIGEWTEEEGSLYVASLNVRPDYHGKKIGKALMLKAVERTAELGWPRLDLHTWAGNTKAVPLYKKTGFFWEERDQMVYCVNFIPGVLRNELVSDFFEDADWYDDSTRLIKVEPDGRRDNEFVYFTYSWEKRGRHLSMEFARRGRGLRGIDRDEYGVTATVENLNLVFKRKYKVRYDFVNRTDPPLDIAISGRDDRNIRFDFSYEGTVEDELSVEGEFYVGEIEGEQSEWKTHPRVSAEISINGKKALFQIGVAPQFPASIRFERKRGLCFTGVRSCAYLNVQSHLDREAEFTLSIPSTADITFPEPEFSVSLPPKGRRSLEIPYILRRSCVYSQYIRAGARPDSGQTNAENIAFKTEVGSSFGSHTGTYHGELAIDRTSRAYVVGNGPFCLYHYHVRDAFRNEASLTHEITEQEPFRLFPPRLGKPFTEEFSKCSPSDVVFLESDGGITMKALFESVDFEDVKLTLCCRLYSSGIAERWFEASYAGKEAMDEGLYLREAYRFDMDNLVIPYKNRILETRAGSESGFDRWIADDLTENWLFSRGEKGTVGFSWGGDAAPLFERWFLVLEHSLGKLSPGETVRTEPTTAAISTFARWRDFRSFALRSRRDGGAAEESRISEESRMPQGRLVPAESLEFRLNGGNPFVCGTFQGLVSEHRQMNLDGVLTVTSPSGRFSAATQSFTKEKKQKTARMEISLGGAAAIHVVELEADLTARCFHRRKVVFGKGQHDVETRLSSAGGHTVFEADNGVLAIRCAPQYAASLYSCTYQGREWLHSHYPEKGPFVWWNPWIGGLHSLPDGMHAGPLLKEKADAEFVKREDVHGNSWSGIAVKLRFSEHEEYKGLEYIQYFLLLPSVPVLYHQVEVHQNTGGFFNRKRFCTALFCRADEKEGEGRFAFKSRQGQSMEIKSGREHIWMNIPSMPSLGGSGREERLYCYADRNPSEMQIQVTKKTTGIWVFDPVTAEDGDVVLIPPKYCIFSEEELEEEWLADLRGVTLKA